MLSLLSCRRIPPVCSMTESNKEKWAKEGGDVLRLHAPGTTGAPKWSSCSMLKKETEAPCTCEGPASSLTVAASFGDSCDHQSLQITPVAVSIFPLRSEHKAEENDT